VNAAEIRALVPTVLEVFEHHFGVTAIVVMTAPDQPGEPFHLLLDASRGESSIVAQARLAGAREKFYEALISLLSGPVLDAIEFDFSFPNT